jgi:hypothetical protein
LPKVKRGRMSRGFNDSAQRRYSSALRKILLTAFTGSFVYLLTNLVPNTPQIWVLTVSVFTGGVILVAQFLIEFDERLAQLEQKLTDHHAAMQLLVEQGFSKITTTIELFGMVEGSALPTEVVTQFVRNATEINPDPIPLIYRFAQTEIARMSQLLRELGKGGEVAYDGEDRDWLLALTRNVRFSIRATSLASVDAAGFWMSDLGQLYLEIQHEVAKRDVTIQRVFILDRADFAMDPDFTRICRWQREHNIDVRVLDPSVIPGPWKLDFILFDETVSYETTPAMQVHSEPRPTITNTRLVLDQDKVKTRINRFNEVWELATPYRE